MRLEFISMFYSTLTFQFIYTFLSSKRFKFIDVFLSKCVEKKKKRERERAKKTVYLCMSKPPTGSLILLFLVFQAPSEILDWTRANSFFFSRCCLFVCLFINLFIIYFISFYLLTFIYLFIYLLKEFARVQSRISDGA